MNAKYQKQNKRNQIIKNLVHYHLTGVKLDNPTYRLSAEQLRRNGK